MPYPAPRRTVTKKTTKKKPRTKKKTKKSSSVTVRARIVGQNASTVLLAIPKNSLSR